DLGAFHETELQQPALQLLDADAVVARMGLGPHLGDHPVVARPRLAEAHEPAGRVRDGGVVAERFGQHVVHIECGAAFLRLIIIYAWIVRSARAAAARVDPAPAMARVPAAHGPSRGGLGPSGEMVDAADSKSVVRED